MRCCPVCGGTSFRFQKVLWQKLIDEWQISPSETDYIDHQQGESCTGCGANLRSMVLAKALLEVFGAHGSLADFATRQEAGGYRMLEINEAGTLNPVLSRMPGHTFGAYPELDMHGMGHPDGTFDVVVHSDTLEHVPNPVHALIECRRVLRAGGALCYTVPIVVGRMSRGREGLPKSFHGDASVLKDDWAVQTEFGADAWTYPMQAGFSEVKIHTIDFPAALAITAYR